MSKIPNETAIFVEKRIISRNTKKKSLPQLFILATLCEYLFYHPQQFFIISSVFVAVLVIFVVIIRPQKLLIQYILRTMFHLL